MIFVYIFIIGLPAALIFFVAKRMKKVNDIKKHGITTDAIILNVVTRRFNKSSMDILTLEYKDAAGRVHPAKANVGVGQYRVGQRLPVKYLPQNPSQYAFNLASAFWFVLVFCILLLLFMIFASYKIHEAVQAGHF